MKAEGGGQQPPPLSKGSLMFYQFRCQEHGEFVIRQSINEEHKASCAVCGSPAQRIYLSFQWMWGNSVFRPDGSYREDKDYAMLKG